MYVSLSAGESSNNVSELPQLLKKVFPTFRLLSPEISECFLPEARLAKTEQPIFEISKFFE